MASKHRIGDSAKMNLNPEEWRSDLNIPMPLHSGPGQHVHSAGASAA